MTKNKKITRISWIILISMMFLALQANVAFAARKVLGVPEYTQQPYDLLCWATVSSMVISFFKGDTIDRKVDIAKDKWGDTDFNKPAYITDEKQAVYNYTQITGSIQYNALSYTAVQYQINNNGPIHTTIDYDTSLSHAQVIKGYDTSLGNEVIYNDPWDGKGHGASYSYYLSNSSWNWSESLFYK